MQSGRCCASGADEGSRRAEEGCREMVHKTKKTHNQTTQNKEKKKNTFKVASPIDGVVPVPADAPEAGQQRRMQISSNGEDSF